ncbi:MAG: P-II family nitrogen regulator [Armatimonadota bacterium]
MKQVLAIIRPQAVETVKDALHDIGIEGLTVTEVQGCGRQKGYTDHFRMSTITVNLLPKAEVSVVVPDDKLSMVLDVIQDTARTGEIGDGKIFVTSLVASIRIRTGETGDAAL